MMKNEKEDSYDESNSSGLARAAPKRPAKSVPQNMIRSTNLTDSLLGS